MRLHLTPISVETRPAKLRDWQATMKIREHDLDDVAVLALSGNLMEDSTYEQGTVEDHVDRLIRNGKTLVVLDLTNVGRIDAMGLGEIAEACVRARSRGADLKLLRPHPHVDRLLSVTKLRTVIDVCDREEEIFNFFDRPPPNPEPRTPNPELPESRSLGLAGPHPRFAAAPQ